MKSKSVLLIFQFLSLSHILCAQDMNTFQDSFKNYFDLRQPEEIYLHINNNFLICGESLQFKVFCRKSQSQEPSLLSRLAYIELLDDNHDPILQGKIDLLEGSGSGEFFLPANIPSGNYRLLAYTNWMKNQGSSRFFETWLSIINPFLPLEVSEDGNLPLQRPLFWVEGSNLLEGIPNRVHYQIPREGTKQLPQTAHLLNSQGDTLQKITLNPEGIGSFEFIPQETSYSFVLINQNKQSFSFTLPPAQKSGIQIWADRKPNVLALKISASPSQAAIGILHHQGTYIQEKKLSLSPQVESWDIPWDLLPEGISWLSLFNTQKELIWERALYKEAVDTEPLIQLSPQNSRVSNREKVRLEWKSSGELPPSEILDVSVSVRKKMPQTYLPPPRILSSFSKNQWSSRNAPYTSQEGKKSWQAIRLLQEENHLTDWQKVFLSNFKQIQYLPELRGDLLSGNLSREGKPLSNQIMTLSAPGKDYYFLAAKTDTLGRFYFHSQHMREDHEVVLQAPKLLDKSYQITLDPEFWPQHTPNPPPPLQLGLEWRDYLKDLSTQVQIENAYYRKKTSAEAQAPPPLPFYGEVTEFYYLDEYTRFPDLIDVIREYVKSAAPHPQDKSFPIRVRNKLNGLSFKNPPLVLLDGIPITNIDSLLNYKASQIKAISVYNEHFYYGPLECEGILDFRTYDGDYNNYPLSDQVVKLPLISRQTSKAFYQPDYAQNEQDTRRIPDFRQQLYWNPHLKGKPGELPLIEFYTGDDTGVYEVILEGLSQSGEIIYHTAEFQVSPKP